MNINPAQSAAANLVALISASNGDKPLGVDDVSFGAPADFDNGAGGNTQVVATAEAGSTLYIGSQTFNYGRLALADATYVGAALELTNVDETAETEVLLLAAVEELGLIPDEVEAGDVSLPVGANNGSLEINAVAGSLLYTGSIVVTLFPIEQREALDTAFGTQDLDALEPPANV